MNEKGRRSISVCASVYVKRVCKFSESEMRDKSERKRDEDKLEEPGRE